MQSFMIFMLFFLPAEDDPFRGEDHMLARLEFKEARIVDAIQLISEISGLNTVATAEAGKKEVTLLMQEVSASQAVEVLCKVAGLWYRRDTDTQTFRVGATFVSSTGTSP